MSEIKVRRGYIYEYLSPAGKYYIGQTININKRKSEHRHFKSRNSLIDRAIRNYGESSFRFRVLFFTVSKDVRRLKTILNTLESYYIRKYRREGKIMYNILEGGIQGNSPIWTEDRKEYMRNVMLKRRAKGCIGNKGRKMDSHTKEALIKSNSVIVLQYSPDGNLISKWNSIAEASRNLHILVTSICNCLSGRTKTAGGFIWKYEQ